MPEQLNLWDGQDSDSHAASESSPLQRGPRIFGGLLGFACGDAMGSTLEQAGPCREMLTEIEGPWGERTEMALATIEAILESPEDPLRCLEATGARPSRRDSTDNGSLPRALVALAYHDPRTLLLHGARLSALTHWNPQAEVCCAVYALWIRELLGGRDRYAAWREAIRIARDYEKGGALALDTPGPKPLPDLFWHRLENVTDLAFADLQPSGYAGYCLEALEAAAWCAIFAADAEQAIVDAVNLAGASASLGSLAGGVAGVHWGVDGLPERWLAELAEREKIEQLAERLGS